MSKLHKYRIQLKPNYSYSANRSTEISHKLIKKGSMHCLTSSETISIETGAIGSCTGLESEGNLGLEPDLGWRPDIRTQKIPDIPIGNKQEYELNKTPLTVATPASWVDNFRNVYSEDKHFAKHWFWDNFQWDKQSLWIGKFNKTNHLPDNDSQIIDFLKLLINNLNQKVGLQAQIYIKFYFARNFKTKDPEINYLLICNKSQLPNIFLGTLVDITFERYQLTESIINRDSDFKRMLNHYLNWSNFYIYYNLMEELQY